MGYRQVTFSINPSTGVKKMKTIVDVYFKGFTAPVPMPLEQAFTVLSMESLAPLVVQLVPNVVLSEESKKEN